MINKTANQPEHIFYQIFHIIFRLYHTILLPAGTLSTWKNPPLQMRCHTFLRTSKRVNIQIIILTISFLHQPFEVGGTVNFQIVGTFGIILRIVPSITQSSTGSSRKSRATGVESRCSRCRMRPVGHRIPQLLRDSKCM